LTDTGLLSWVYYLLLSSTP